MRYSFPLIVFLVSGCCNGPTHAYYSPVVANAPKVQGPITMEMVGRQLPPETEMSVRAGYTVLGKSDYIGKYPEACELQAQARRVHANRVIYGVERVTATPGWHFRYNAYGGAGGSNSDQWEVHIVFLRK